MIVIIRYRSVKAERTKVLRNLKSQPGFEDWHLSGLSKFHSDLGYYYLGLQSLSFGNVTVSLRSLIIFENEFVADIVTRANGLTTDAMP